MMLHLIRSFDIPWLCLLVSLRNSLWFCSFMLCDLWWMSISSSFVLCHGCDSSSSAFRHFFVFDGNTSFQHAHTPSVFVMHTVVVAVLPHWSSSLYFVDSTFWRRILLRLLMLLDLCENSFDFEMYVWACGSSAARWSSTRKQFKHVSKNQPVLTGLELEIVNSIVWRLLLILAMAVPESDTLERACKIY